MRVNAVHATLRSTVIAGLLVSFPLPALADDALGTLTVKGKTIVLAHVVATEETDPEDPAGKWLVALLSDKPVAAADRSPDRLRELAAQGKLKGLRVLWKVGYDSVRAVPYHAALPASGRLGVERPTLNLTRYDEKRVEAEVRSKMVGQDWHFQVRLKANVTKGGTLQLETEATEEELLAGAGGTGDERDVTKKKIALGKLGYEATPDMFTHAISDGNLEAVKLFLSIGTSPNVVDEARNHPMILAAQGCSHPKVDVATRSAVLKALVAAGGDVKAADGNGSTPLLWAVQTGCSLDAVQALLKAGSDPNAKAKGGATPLMMADVFQRADVAQALKKAGAKPWK